MSMFNGGTASRQQLRAGAVRALILTAVTAHGGTYASGQSLTPGSTMMGPTATSPAFSARLAAAFQELETRQMPVIVALSHHGGPPIVREFGALARDGLPGASTLIDVNSITKTITAVMVAKLVERGALRFDTRLDEIFEDVPHDKAQITVHQLLTHAAGLPEKVGEDAERIGKAAFVRRVWHTRLRSAPGSIYHYANVGYGLLAAIIEARAQKPYEAFLREDVLPDHCLEATGYASVYQDARSMRNAHGESIASASWGGHPPMWNLIGNGGLVSTVTDMLRFRQALVAGQIVSRDTLARIQRPHIAEDEGDSHYGYGVVVSEVAGIGRIYSHDGGNGAFSAQWADYADQGDLVFTAAADSQHGDAMSAMAVIAAHLYAAPAD